MADDMLLMKRFEEHNLHQVCVCSVCTIVRMCDRMEEMTKRTNARIAAMK